MRADDEFFAMGSTEEIADEFASLGFHAVVEQCASLASQIHSDLVPERRVLDVLVRSAYDAR